NNLRLVQNENNRSELFCYPKDRAKVVHTPWDCESALKNNLRYLCFDILLSGCGAMSSCIGNELQSLDNGQT
ncbi:hypothetical protein, partial [Limosilactobacillus antri]|uniref:hypothetical protein n=2 Tax=Limosilactobacillus antri TaxID=227943 RepID=UPI001CDD34D1